MEREETEQEVRAALWAAWTVGSTEETIDDLTRQMGKCPASDLGAVANAADRGWDTPRL